MLFVWKNIIVLLVTVIFFCCLLTKWGYEIPIQTIKGSTVKTVQDCTNKGSGVKEPWNSTIIGSLEKPACESACSFRATQRGPGQKVVSFSFYGKINTSRQYFQGIQANADILQTYYPGWLMRVYHDVPPSNHNVSSTIFLLQENNTFLDFCYMGDIPGYGNLTGSQQNIWRFLPLADHLVDVFVSRDLDSRPSQREALAVQHWLDSGLPFHTMRDHPGHGTSILAGMWGAVTKEEHMRMLDLWTEILSKGKVAGRKGLDQSILASVVWPKIKGEVMQHDSFYCERYRRHGNMTPWPSRRVLENYNFVGARFKVDLKPTSYTCPMKCRPSEQGDWTYC